jgi:predicted DNA-binding transcriptional regulator YafY
MSKYVKLNQLIQLMRATGELTEAQIAQKLDVNRRTVNNWLNELQRIGEVYVSGRTESNARLWACHNDL